MKASIILCTLIAASALLAAAGETKNAPAAEGAKKTSLEGKTVANADNNLLKNGSFNEPAKRPQKSFKDGKAPSGWYGGKLKPDGELAWIPIAPGSSNYVVHVKNSNLTHDLSAKAEKYRVNFRYRGKADLTFYILRYKKKGGPLPSAIIHTLKADTDKWTDGKFDFPKAGEFDEERQVFAIWVQNGGVDLDEVYLAPVSK